MENKDIDEIFAGLLSVFPVFAKKIHKIGDDALRNEEISKAHVHLMRYLKVEGPCTMTDLGKMLYVSKPNITTLVDKLVELNMVQRTFAENDRRVIYIELTHQGHDFLIKRMETMKAAFVKTMQKLNADDLAMFKETINNMKMLVAKMEE